MTIVEAERAVIGGIDTHLDVHVAAAVDPVGGLLGVESFAASPAGYNELLGWLSGFGRLSKVGGGGHRRLWGGRRPLPTWRRYRGHRGGPAQPPGAEAEGQVRSR